MAWTNLKQHDPGATLVAFKDGGLVDPGDYLAEGIVLAWNGDAVEFTFPQNGSGYSAMAVPSTPALELPPRLVGIEHDPWIWGYTPVYLTTIGVEQPEGSGLAEADTTFEFADIGVGNPYDGFGLRAGSPA